MGRRRHVLRSERVSHYRHSARHQRLTELPNVVLHPPISENPPDLLSDAAPLLVHRLSNRTKVDELSVPVKLDPTAMGVRPSMVPFGRRTVLYFVGADGVEIA